MRKKIPWLLAMVDGLGNKHWSIRLASTALLAVTILTAFPLSAAAAPSSTQPSSNQSSPKAVQAKTNIQQSSAAKGPTDPQEVTAFLDQFFARDDVKKQFRAIAVSVVKDGKVIAEKGYGSDPSQTVFRIASVSKTYVATAVMQLAEQGKISLQDNIEKYLGGYKVTNPFSKPVTIENLLLHTAGFKDIDTLVTRANIFQFNNVTPQISLEKAVFSYFPPVIREPGTTFMYDNFSYVLLGYIVQQASGEPFEMYMKNHIFKPLGMTSSSFVMTDDLKSRMAIGHDYFGAEIQSYRLSPEPLPTGGMVSTAADQSRFILAILNGGITADGERILSEDSVKTMTTYHRFIHPDVADTAYGFDPPILKSTNGYNVIVKEGGMPGFSSLIWLLLDQKTGVFMVNNMNSLVHYNLFDAFMNHYYPGTTEIGDPAFPSQPMEVLAKFEVRYLSYNTGVYARNLTIKANTNGTLTATEFGIGAHHVLKQRGEMLFVDDAGQPYAFKAVGSTGRLQLDYNNQSGFAFKVPDPSDVPNAPISLRDISIYVGLLSVIALFIVWKWKAGKRTVRNF